MKHKVLYVRDIKYTYEFVHHLNLNNIKANEIKRIV